MWRRQLLRHLGEWSCRPSVTSRRPFTACVSAVAVHGNTATIGHSPRQQGTLPAARWGQPQIRLSHMSSLDERGVYDERAYQHVKGSEVKSLELVSDGRLVSIQWSDGSVSRFHSVWLRYHCFCPACRLDHTGQPTVRFDQVPEQSRLVSAMDDGEGCLIVEWKEDPGHKGMFPLKYLKGNCYSKESLENNRKNLQMTFSKDCVIPRVGYEEVMTTRSGLYKWVKALNETGISIVENVPCEEGMVVKVCQRIADCIQHTIYGETFDVKTKVQPINAAYSSAELTLHMDQVMYESPPGLQALHCISFDANIRGGDSLFVDLFQVAEVFREKYPEDFDVLCKLPVCHETVHYRRDWPVHMRYHRPMFSLNQHGDLIGVIWHPQLLGPQQVEEENVETFCRAFGRFYSLINNFPHYFRHRLEAGQMVIFNNRRVLHGRSAFTSTEGHRFLQGTYVEISEFRSCVQVLSNLEGDGRPPIRVGDYDLQ